MMVTDEELCDQVRTGSKDAFSELWNRHHGEAVGYARKLNPALAEDAVADVMALLYESLRKGNGPDSSFRSYLLLSVRNRIYRSATQPRVDELPEEHLLTDEAQPVSVESNEDSAVVHAALMQLPDRWREVLLLSEVQGKSLAEVGLLMGLESNAVSALLRRARAGLRRSWVSAHFAGAKLGSECSNVVEAFGEFRWGKPSDRQREWFERHVSNCDDCSERRGTHAWLAQAVGLAALPLVWIGGMGLSKGSKVAAMSAPKPAVLGAGFASATVLVAAVALASLSLSTGQAKADTSPQTPQVQRSEQPTETASQSDDGRASNASATEQLPTGDLSVDAVADSATGDQSQSAPAPSSKPVVLPEPAPAISPEPEPAPVPPIATSQVSVVPTERIIGSSRPGANLEFRLSDGSTVTAVADTNGDFVLEVAWPADKPTFGYALQRVY